MIQQGLLTVVLTVKGEVSQGSEGGNPFYWGEWLSWK